MAKNNIHKQREKIWYSNDDHRSYVLGQRCSQATLSYTHGDRGICYVPIYLGKRVFRVRVENISPEFDVAWEADAVLMDMGMNKYNKSNIYAQKKLAGPEPGTYTRDNHERLGKEDGDDNNRRHGTQVKGREQNPPML